ncbi:MAG TPA: histidine kinase [Gaiellaceae bacterium]|nr:histidine kinase [Gaiellaceae bacterium]
MNDDAARLADQLISAEQEERRRLALALHDGPVQSLSGIALMLDAARAALDAGNIEQAQDLLASVVDRQRDAIRSLRDLSFALEPIILRDQGFVPAVRALAEQLGVSEQIRIDLDVDAGEELAERVQVTLYQIIREALHQSLLRGPPTRVSIAIAAVDGGGVETVIADDGAAERRRRVFEPLEERARAVNGTVEVEPADDHGTVIRVTVPGYTAR